MRVISSVAEHVVGRCRGRKVLYCGVSDCAGGIAFSANATRDVALSWRGLDKEAGLPAKFPALDLRVVDLNDDFTTSPRSWWDGDLLVMTEVLEHLWSPVLTLRRLASVLPGVEFVLSMPNGLSAGRLVMAVVAPTKYRWQDGTHTALFNRQVIAVVMAAAGIGDYSVTPYMQRGTPIARLFPDLAQGYVVEGLFPAEGKGVS